MADGDENSAKKIVVMCDGPYSVEGGIPLVRKSPVVTEYGEPVAWKKDAHLETSREYCLCRCGHSHEKPFCDGTHAEIGFDGTETADTGPTAERQATLVGGKQIIVRRDTSLCMEAGFCGNRFSNIEQMLAGSEDTRVRALLIAMIEHCPSGSYTCSLQERGGDIEPDLPQQVAVISEATSEGPIMGPLWVTGQVTIERSDGQPLETRNRVTLCRCGLSKIKPLCDGTHRAEHIEE